MPKRSKNIQYYEATGRHKEAVARVRLNILTKAEGVAANGQKVGRGEIVVNKKPIAQIFPNPADKLRYLIPLRLTNNEDRFAVTITTHGGGRNGQLLAIRQGLARALLLVDSSAYRPILKKEKLLVRDPRTRERRKVGTGGKARRAKQSPKR